MSLNKTHEINWNCRYLIAQNRTFSSRLSLRKLSRVEIENTKLHRLKWKVLNCFELDFRGSSGLTKSLSVIESSENGESWMSLILSPPEILSSKVRYHSAFRALLLQSLFSIKFFSTAKKKDKKMLRLSTTKDIAYSLCSMEMVWRVIMAIDFFPPSSQTKLKRAMIKLFMWYWLIFCVWCSRCSENNIGKGARKWRNGKTRGKRTQSNTLFFISSHLFASHLEASFSFAIYLKLSLL